jgi:predicted nucleotidyltransferase
MELITFLKNNPNSRKIFGERELKIIEKQIQGVNLTQSEKNRLSRDIRKKLEIIKELTKFSDEFELKKASSSKRLIQDIKKEILNHVLKNKIKKIILFGSFVENKLNLNSDLDIAVEFSAINEKEAFNFRKAILGNFSDKIDLQVFNLLPDKIKKDIREKGKIIYNVESN